MVAAQRDEAEAGLRLIVAYKLAKAAGEIGLAAFLGVVVSSGAAIPAAEVAAALSRRVAAAWSLDVSRFVGLAAAPQAMEVTAAALVLDGLLTLGEGWALHRRFAWAPWLVVVSTGSLLPFESFELIRRPDAVRLLLLVVNGAIVWYLAARATRAVRMRRSARSPGTPSGR
jgi:uncharacterized membrane protein (DUF2068 family)